VTFRRVAALADVWNGDLLPITLDGIKVLVVKIEDAVHAYEDRCAHLGAQLSNGALDGRVLTCAVHHWQYDATTGRGINPASACLTRFAVEIRDGIIFVDPEVRL